LVVFNVSEASHALVELAEQESGTRAVEPLSVTVPTESKPAGVIVMRCDTWAAGEPWQEAVSPV
jgi:hypothetical protein